MESSYRGDAELAAALGVDRTQVSQRLSDASLFFFEVSGERYFPAWQVVAGNTVAGLREVLSAFAPDTHPLVIAHWFQTPSLDLEGDTVSPLEWLASGSATDVVVALLGRE